MVAARQLKPIDEFAERVAALRQMLVVLARRHFPTLDVDDLVQITMLRAIERRTLYTELTTMRGWLFTIMHNEAVNEYKRRHDRPAKDAAYAAIEYAPAPPDLIPPDIFDAIQALPVERRILFVLREIMDFSYAQLADACGMCHGTVMSRLYRARRDVAKSLDPTRNARSL